MSRSWNGSSLVTELSALLGDTSTAFQARVTGWLNDIQFDIGTRFDWAFHKVKGQKNITTGSEEYSLEVSTPSAPVVALASGGSLTSGSAYYVLITYLQANGVESIAGPTSSIASPSGANLTINLSSITVSSNPLVTQRNIYLKKDTGKYFFHSTIANNVATTATISTNTALTIEPPDYAAIRKLSGSPFIELSSTYLRSKDLEQLRYITGGNLSTGTPEYFSMIDPNSIVFYPKPSSAIVLSFDYYRYPFRLFNADDSQPDLPIYLKQVLKAGVIAMGFEYRDRSGQETKKQTYELMLIDAFNRYGKPANVDYTIRDVYGNVEGNEVG